MAILILGNYWLSQVQDRQESKLGFIAPNIRSSLSQRLIGHACCEIVDAAMVFLQETHSEQNMNQHEEARPFQRMSEDESFCRGLQLARPL